MQEFLDSLDVVDAARRAADAVRPRPPVHRPARPRRGQPRAGAGAARRRARARCGERGEATAFDLLPGVYGDKLMPETAAWLLTKMLCYLEHLEATGRVRRVRSRAGALVRRLDLAAMRIDERIASERRAVLLLRVLPAPHRRGRAQPGPRAGGAVAARARRSSRSPTAPPAARPRSARRSTSSRTSSATTAWRRWRTSRASSATTGELREMLDTMRDAGIENVLALRGDPPRGQNEWTADRGRPELLARADRADPRRVRLRDRRRLLPRGPHPRRRRRERPALPARRRSTPARAS